MGWVLTLWQQIGQAMRNQFRLIGIVEVRVAFVQSRYTSEQPA
jgi:hypothetical protein